MTAPLSLIPGGVATPRGFRAAGISAGIKASGNPDLALLVADQPAQIAAVFTTNKVLAAPVLVSQDHLARSGGTVRAIVVNSGCANACTGDAGMRDAREMTAETARLVGCPVEQVLVASTGVIGVGLPMDKVRGGLPVAFKALGADHGPQAARAIMTTDLRPKESAARVSIGGRDALIGGMAKGAGMIEPMMATMLGFVTTDAAVPKALLDRALREAVDRTFNAITVDGDSSTNDCVLLLASGAAGVVVDEAGYGAFVEGLTAVCRELALAIVRGGEGATKLVAVNVTGAATSAEARKAAKVIANSLLVKTAIHGGDPNWGRLICAAGRAGVTFDASRAAVTMGPLVLFKDGQPHDELAPAAAEYLKGPDLSIGVDLGSGAASSTVWTCDLSAEYVRINADYRT
ncbi:MAG TPA: bifunctional glutamate N-acetyltransferase/amino-acid acetyltransferase ArgJ [Vicinamibacterales bacterium]|nr:bifunctional glutamate N-acetyltransferase/amino-acid acetyltransferase ArgJ [Vicinamibacterales bacterium]